MQEGFVIVYRDLLDWQYHDNPNAVALWIYILLKARWSDGFQNGVEIRRGQLMTTLATISAETGLNTGVINRLLKKFESDNQISVKTTNRFSVINVINYAKFQSLDGASGKQTENKRKTNGKQTENAIFIRNKETKETKKQINTLALDLPVSLADVEAIPLDDGTEWKPTTDEYNEWCRIYPNLDVKQKIAEMRSWCNSNPTKRKTKTGVKRFVNSWLSRDNEKRQIQASNRRSKSVPEYMANVAEDNTSASREQVEELRKLMSRMENRND